MTLPKQPLPPRSTWSGDGRKRHDAGDKASLCQAQGVRGQEKCSGLAEKCTLIPGL